MLQGGDGTVQLELVEIDAALSDAQASTSADSSDNDSPDNNSTDASTSPISPDAEARTRDPALNATAAAAPILVFLDPDAVDARAQIESIATQQEGQLIVVCLQTDVDSLQQISEALSRYEQVDGIHLIGTNQDGTFEVGNQR